MLLTLDASLTGGAPVPVCARADATVGQVLASLGIAPREVWCGPRRLPTDHAICADPVRSGSVLAALPLPPHATWPGPRLVSVCGPDVGRVVAIEGITACGSGDPFGWRDPSMDAVHARAWARADGSITLEDADSTNGVRRWRQTSRLPSVAWRRRVTLAPGERAALGHTVVEARTGDEPDCDEAAEPSFPVRWADLARGAHDTGAGRLLVGAIDAAPAPEPWLLPFDAEWTVLASGAPRSGRSTLLAMIACAAAAASTPTSLRLALVARVSDPALSPVAALPHVLAVDHARADEALVWARAAAPERRTLLIVDDADGLDHSALASLQELVGQGPRPGLLSAVSVSRPAGVFTPRMLATATHVVALRAASAQASTDIVGVPDAADLPPDEPGAALVRHRGARRRVRVALPVATPTPAAWPVGCGPGQGEHLAARLAAAWT